MKVFYKIGGALLIFGLLTISLLSDIQHTFKAKDSEERLPKTIKSQQPQGESLYWEDRQKGIGFNYPRQFELIQKQCGVILTKSENRSVKVFVFLNPDLLARDNAEVYEQMRGHREKLLSWIGDPDLQMMLPIDQTRQYCEKISGIEILCVDDEVILQKGQDHQRGQLKMRYGCFEGQGVAVGYLGSGGEIQTYQDGEICIEMILNSIKRLDYQGPSQLMIPEDISFEKKPFLKGEIRIPKGWRTHKLSKTALCYRPDPLRGDKLAGMKIMGTIWNHRDRKTEKGFEDRLFLKDYEALLGTLVLQSFDSTKRVKVTFYQKERQWKNQNGRDWTIVKGYFNFEPQEEPFFSMPNHQAMVCYSQNNVFEGSVIIFLWDRRTGSFDAEKIADSVLETFQ